VEADGGLVMHSANRKLEQRQIPGLTGVQGATFGNRLFREQLGPVP